MTRWGRLVVLLASVGPGCGGSATTEVACARASGVICTVAGTGVAGDGADGSEALKTMLYLPADVAFTPAGALVVVDWNNHRIRAVQPNGMLKIVAGEGELGTGMSVDDVTSRLNHPTDVTFDAQGRMVIAAWHNSRIKRVDMTTGHVEDIAGTGARGWGGDDGPALSAVLNLPASVVYDPQGNLYVSDQANQRIRRIDTAGTITTVAGSGMKGFRGDGGPALAASFSLPVGQQGHPAAHITRSAAGDIFLADTENSRIRRIDGTTGIVGTLAGSDMEGFAGEGTLATEARLLKPVDVAIGPEGGLYFTDTENNCVRVVRDGVISTVAGICGSCEDSIEPRCLCDSTDGVCLGEGKSARAASLKHPSGIAFDREGNLYIADTVHHRIRVVYR